MIIVLTMTVLVPMALQGTVEVAAARTGATRKRLCEISREAQASRFPIAATVRIVAAAIWSTRSFCRRVLGADTVREALSRE
jgi:hypothetical protein